MPKVLLVTFFSGHGVNTKQAEASGGRLATCIGEERDSCDQSEQADENDQE